MTSGSQSGETRSTETRSTTGSPRAAAVRRAALIGSDDGPQPDFSAAVREATLLLILTNGPTGYDELTRLLTDIHGVEGWASGSQSGLAGAVRTELYTLRHRLWALHLLGGERGCSAPLSLTRTGVAAALAALLARALRPRHHLGLGADRSAYGGDDRPRASGLRCLCVFALCSRGFYGKAPVMSEPGTPMGAAVEGRGRLRTSRADREQVLEVLKTAFVQGRLTKDEFEERVDRTLTSRTYAELAAITADIPAGLTDTQRVHQPKPPRRPTRTRTRVSMNTAVTAGAFVAIATNIAMVGALVAGSAVAAIAVGVFFAVAAVVAIGAMLVAR